MPFQFAPKTRIPPPRRTGSSGFESVLPVMLKLIVALLIMLTLTWSPPWFESVLFAMLTV